MSDTTPEAQVPEATTPEATSVDAGLDPSALEPASGLATADAAAPSPAADAGAPTDGAEVPLNEPAPAATDQPTGQPSDAVDPWPDDEDPAAAYSDGVKPDEPVQSLSQQTPDADPNPAFHGQEQAVRPDPEPQTAYSDKPAPGTVV